VFEELIGGLDPPALIGVSFQDFREGGVSDLTLSLLAKA
jgi:hypothetical protein